MKKKILVVGCLGHIGFSLASYLKKKYDIYGTYNNTINNSLIKELALKKNYLMLMFLIRKKFIKY
jgi:nucleoside-diphosphate-sugar epimerase